MATERHSFLTMEESLHPTDKDGNGGVGGGGGAAKQIYLPIIIFNANTKTWDCFDCDKSFKLQCELEEHAQSHNPNKTSKSAPPPAALPAIQLGPFAPSSATPPNVTVEPDAEVVLEATIIEEAFSPHLNVGHFGTCGETDTSKCVDKMTKKKRKWPPPEFTNKTRRKLRAISKSLQIVNAGHCCNECQLTFFSRDAFQEHLQQFHQEPVELEQSPQEQVQVAMSPPPQNEEPLPQETTENSATVDCSGQPEATCSFPCKLCSSKLPSEEDLLQHIMDLHSKQFLIDGQFYYCHDCQIKYSRLCSFHSHLRLQHMTPRPEEEPEVTSSSSGNANQDDGEISVVNVVVRGTTSETFNAVVKVEVDPDGDVTKGQQCDDIFPGSEAPEDDGEEYLHKCKMCNKIFPTVKALRLHERMIHADELMSKFAGHGGQVDNHRPPPKINKRQRRRSSKEEYRHCQKIIEDLKKKLGYAEKLIKKTVQKCRTKRVNNSDREGGDDRWACKVTPSGIKIFSKGKPSNGVIGSKWAAGGEDKLVEDGESYQCAVCELKFSSPSILKKHVMAEHVDRMEGSDLEGSQSGRVDSRNSGICDEGAMRSPPEGVQIASTTPVIQCADEFEQYLDSVLNGALMESPATLMDGVMERLNESENNRPRSIENQKLSEPMQSDPQGNRMEVSKAAVVEVVEGISVKGADHQANAATPSKKKADLKSDIGKRELRIILTRVDDDEFDFSELLFLKKMC